MDDLHYMCITDLLVTEYMAHEAQNIYNCPLKQFGNSQSDLTPIKTNIQEQWQNLKVFQKKYEFLEFLNKF